MILLDKVYHDFFKDRQDLKNWMENILLYDVTLNYQVITDKVFLIRYS